MLGLCNWGFLNGRSESGVGQCCRRAGFPQWEFFNGRSESNCRMRSEVVFVRNSCNGGFSNGGP